MNKKGDLFMLGLNILFLIAIIMIFWKLSSEFRQENADEGLGTRQTALLQTYMTAEQFLLQLDTTATFAAYAAVLHMLERGGIDQGLCGTYAGYTLWSTAEKSCIPDRAAINREFVRETLAQIKSTIPQTSSISYESNVSVHGSMLSLRSKTTDRIEFPIVSAKRAKQAAAAAAASANNVARTIKGPIQQDSALVTTTAGASRREVRSSAPTGVLIFTSGSDPALTVASYTKGDMAIHYVMSTDGSVTQTLPESEQAFCDQCTNNIVIALSGDKPWEKAQYDAVVSLVADVATRNHIKIPDGLMFRQELHTINWPTKTKLATDIIAEQNSPMSSDQTTQDQNAAIQGATSKQGTSPQGTITVSWPTTVYTISSCWGDRPSNNDVHDGIDVPGGGNDVFAFADGVVRRACAPAGSQTCGGYGNMVLLEHPNGLWTRYSHLTSFSVSEGEQVTGGQKIGITGNTGNSHGAHLDFKVYADKDVGKDKAKNALCYFPDDVLAKLPSTTQSNCGKFKSFTRTDPQMQKDCAGISSANILGNKGCFTGSQTINVNANGDQKVTLTLTRLAKANLITEIEDEAKKRGVDPKLAIAIIADRKSVV